jgi:hypothetical protein
VTQSELRRDVEQRLDGVIARAATLTGALTATHLAWVPPEGGWSVGQVLEHCVRCIEAYDGVLARLRTPGGASERATTGEWKSSFVGNFLANAMLHPRKVRTQRIWDVTGPARDDIVAAFAAAHRGLLAAMGELDRLDWQRTRLASPAAWFLRYNLGDAFRILALHAERHLGQIERLIARADFPR